MVHPLRILLASVVAATIAPSPCLAAWKPEPMSQSYVNLGCGSDAGTLLLSINTGTTKYLLSSTSPLFKSAYSITTKAVANDRRIQVYALSGFPTVRRSYTNENGVCSEMSGVEPMGIGFEGPGSSTSIPRPLQSSRGISVSRVPGELKVDGATGSVEVATVGGRLLARRLPDARGSVALPLQGLPRGVLLVRCGDRVVTYHNL